MNKEIRFGNNTGIISEVALSKDGDAVYRIYETGFKSLKIGDLINEKQLKKAHNIGPSVSLVFNDVKSLDNVMGLMLTLRNEVFPKEAPKYMPYFPIIG